MTKNQRFNLIAFIITWTIFLTLVVLKEPLWMIAAVFIMAVFCRWQFIREEQ